MLLVHEYNTPGSQIYFPGTHTHASVVETYLAVRKWREGLWGAGQRRRKKGRHLEEVTEC